MTDADSKTMTIGRPVAHHEMLPFRQRTCKLCDQHGVLHFVGGGRRLCSCMRRRFMRRHAKDVEKGHDGNLWWKAGAAPTLPPVETIQVGGVAVNIKGE